MAEYQSKDLFSQLIAILLLVTAFTIIGQVITMGIMKVAGLDMGPEMFSQLESSGQRQITRLAITAGHIISFTLSSIVFLYIYHRNDYSKFLKIDSIPRTTILYLSFFLLLLSYPIVGKLAEYNLSLPLPEWMISSSDSAQDLLKGILKMNGISELIMSIVLVGITPAIGEELLYRGIIQRKVQKIVNNDHAGILIASLLFSLNHFQFDRFLPFAMLGLILGYAYHYSKNLWVPIILHFINNSFQVMILYGMRDEMEELDFTTVPDIPIVALYMSILATLGLFILMKRFSEKEIT